MTQCSYCWNEIALSMQSSTMRYERGHDRDCIHSGDGDFLEQKRRDVEGAGSASFPRKAS